MKREVYQDFDELMKTLNSLIDENGTYRYIKDKEMRTKEIMYIIFAIKHMKIHMPDQTFAETRYDHIWWKIAYQFHVCSKYLHRDINSRKAVIHEPDFHPVTEACIVMYQFIMNSRENNLDLVVYLRSSDLVDVLPVDMWTANRFLRKMARELNVRRGQVIFSIATLHKYIKDDDNET